MSFLQSHSTVVLLFRLQTNLYLDIYLKGGCVIKAWHILLFLMRNEKLQMRNEEGEKGGFLGGNEVF